MNLYLITPINAWQERWDVYEAAVVCAESIEQAKTIHPDGSIYSNENGWGYNRTWVKTLDQVNVECIGSAIEGSQFGVVLSSFSAG